MHHTFPILTPHDSTFTTNPQILKIIGTQFVVSLLPELSKEMLTEYIKPICSCGHIVISTTYHYHYGYQMEGAVCRLYRPPKKGSLKLIQRPITGLGRSNSIK